MNSKTEACFVVMTKQAKLIPYALIFFVSRTRSWGVVIDRLPKICIHKTVVYVFLKRKNRQNIYELYIRLDKMAAVC